MKNRILGCLLVSTFLVGTAYAQQSVVEQARADLQATGYDVNHDAACVDFEIVKIAVGRLANQGAGLLTKDCCGDFTDPNRTHCEYKGNGYSHDIVAFPDGRIVDVIIGDGHNTAAWNESPADPSLVSRYRSATSLGLTGVVPGVTPSPTPTPTPAPNLDLISRLTDLAAKVDNLTANVTSLQRQVQDLLNKPEPVITLPAIVFPRYTGNTKAFGGALVLSPQAQ